VQNLCNQQLHLHKPPGYNPNCIIISTRAAGISSSTTVIAQVERIFSFSLEFPMICVQSPIILNQQPDTMAGFDPQKLSRSQAVPRYIISSSVLCCFFARYREAVVRNFCIAPQIQRPWLPQGPHKRQFHFPKVGPSRIFTSCSSHVPQAERSL
jgi:hypothetical protein